MRLLIFAAAVQLYLSPLPSPAMAAATLPISPGTVSKLGHDHPVIHCAIDGTLEKWSEYNHTCHENPAERGPAPFPPEQSCLAACTLITPTRLGR